MKRWHVIAATVAFWSLVAVACTPSPETIKRESREPSSTPMLWTDTGKTKVYLFIGLYGERCYVAEGAYGPAISCIRN